MSLNSQNESPVNSQRTSHTKVARYANRIDVSEAKVLLSLLDPEEDRFLFTSLDDDKDREISWNRCNNRTNKAKKEIEHLSKAKGENSKAISDLNEEISLIRHDMPSGIESKLCNIDHQTAWMQRRQDAGFSVTVCVQGMKSNKRRKEDVQTFRAVFAEMDGKQLKAWPLSPSAVVETSPGRFHVYWLIDCETPMTVDVWDGVMRRIVLDYGADPAAKDAARTLRLPGTWNLKKGRAPHMVRIIEAEGFRYSADEITAAFPPIEIKKSDAPTQNWTRFETNDLGLSRFIEPLKAVPADFYLDWIRVGFALHKESGASSEGLAMWRAWSAASSKYQDGECEWRWETFKTTGACDGGAIFGLASDCGWIKPVKAKKTRSKAVAKANPAPIKREKAKPEEVTVDNARGDNEPSPILSPAFEVDKTGAPRRNIRNLKTAVAALGIELTYDEFAMTTRINGEVVQDHIVNKLLYEIEERWDLQFFKDYFYNAIDTMAREKSYHPVRDYLNGLEWDGRPRLNRILIDYCGAEDNAINGVVSSKWFIGSVRRIFNPGCIMRTVLILEGEQWAGKSSFFRIMCTKDEWFTDDLKLDAGGKDTLTQTRGKWLVELAELDSLSKAAISETKRVIAQTYDRGRLPYARCASEVARQYIYGGTTNKQEYLNDPTGGTRFWPVKITKVKFEELKRDVDQLWAEAVYRARAGESHELDAGETNAIKQVQIEKSVVDPWQERIERFLANDEGEIRDCKVRGESLFNLLDVKPERRTQAMNERIGGIMTALGFTRKKARFNDANKRSVHGYIIGTGETEKTFN